MRPALVLLSALLLCPGLAPAATVHGRAVDDLGKPVAGAHVRVALRKNKTTTTAAADFTITAADGSFSAEIAASANDYIKFNVGKRGYMNTGGYLQPKADLPLSDVVLARLSPIDNVNYQWWWPYWPVTDNSKIGCNACHGDHVEAWSKSVMAQSAKSKRVLSYYLGTDLDGHKVGGGYRDLHPDRAGPCANCHAPAAAIDAPGKTRLDQVSGVQQEGVFCDVCHKVRDVRIDHGPGVGGSLIMQRPSAWLGQFAFGPFEDVSKPMSSTYSPLIKTSRLCAGCHEWTNEHGVKVLGTFSEWSEMSGADKDALQCQDCHMKKKFGSDYKPDAEAGKLAYLLSAKNSTDSHIRSMHGVLRPVSELYPHTFAGAAEYIKEAAALEVKTRQEVGDLVVEVRVENVNAGHALPTGMAFRHMLLVVQASADGQELEQVGGSQVPDYGGEGDAPEDYAGRPGKGYAKVLGDGTGARNVPFWDATEILEDTRIRAAESDTVQLRFRLPPGGAKAKVVARLIYRRAFREMVELRKWDVSDTVMAQVEKETTTGAYDPALLQEVEPAGGVDARATSAGDDGGCGATGRGGSPSPWPLGLLVLAVPGVARVRRRGART